MKISQSHLGNFVLTTLLVFCLLLLAREALADSDNEVSIDDGKVEVTYPADRLTSYNQRRPNHTILFGLSIDNLAFGGFQSIEQNYSYEELYGGEKVPLYQLDLGIKYNLAIGGLYGSLIYGHGSISDHTDGLLTTLILQKKGLSLGLILDNFFPEPYVAPYISMQFYDFDWEEQTETMESHHGRTAFSSAIQAGVLLQLNWLDPDSALAGKNSANLNNTFLDLYASQYNTSGAEDDPDFKTDINFGFGLRLEF